MQYIRARYRKGQIVLRLLRNWHSIKRVAQKMGWSRETATKYVEWLYNKGYLKKKHIIIGKAKTRIYKIK